jgi:hypothetical protein
MPLLGPIAHHANIDLPVNVSPLFCGTKLGDQLIEGWGVGWPELEPRQEIEWLVLSKITAVVEPAGDCRQIP